MSDVEAARDDEVLDVVRSETALDLAAFRKFVFRVADVDDDAGIMEAAEDAARRIDEIDARQQWLEQELAETGGDDE